MDLASARTASEFALPGSFGGLRPAAVTPHQAKPADYPVQVIRAGQRTPFYFFLWTADSIEHISQHGVSQEEFEEVVMNPEGETISRTFGNPIAFGTAPSGRILCCVFRRINDDIVQRITAFEVEE